MRKKVWLALVGLVLMLMLLPSHQVQATGASFTIKPELTNAQSKQAGYYELMVKPNQRVQLAMTVSNVTDSRKTIKVSVADAYTGNNGTIGYDPGGPRDDSAKYRLSQLAGKPVKVTLAGGQTKRVAFNLQIPKNGFAGELVGSVYAIDTASYGDDKGQSMAIKNKFAMYSAIVMRVSSQYVRPALKLAKLDLGMQDGQAAVLATLQNIKPEMFGKMSINAKVYKDGGAKPVLTRKVNDYAMAPNSHFVYGIYSKHAFAAGDYQLDLVAKSGSRTWHFKRTIHVSQAKAEQVNKAASLKMANQVPWWLIALIVLLVLIIVLLVVLLFKRRKHADQ